AVRLDEGTLRGMVLAQGLDRPSPVLVTELDCGTVEGGLRLAVELVAPRAKRGRVVIEELFFLEPGVDGVAPDRERATRVRPQLLLEPHRVVLERVRGSLGRRAEGALGGTLERGSGRHHRGRTDTEERHTRGNRPE